MWVGGLRLMCVWHDRIYIYIEMYGMFCYEPETASPPQLKKTPQSLRPCTVPLPLPPFCSSSPWVVVTRDSSWRREWCYSMCGSLTHLQWTRDVFRIKVICYRPLIMPLDIYGSMLLLLLSLLIFECIYAYTFNTSLSNATLIVSSLMHTPLLTSVD